MIKSRQKMINHKARQEREETQRAWRPLALLAASAVKNTEPIQIRIFSSYLRYSSLSNVRTRIFQTRVFLLTKSKILCIVKKLMNYIPNYKAPQNWYWYYWYSALEA